MAGQPKTETLSFEQKMLQEFLVVADFTKYNIHILAKSIIFASLYAHHDIDETLVLTEQAIKSLMKQSVEPEQEQK